MANKSLEEFVKNWDEVQAAAQLAQHLKENPGDESIYNAAVEKTIEYTGLDPRPEDGKPLDDQSVKRLLAEWQTAAQGKAVGYANSNLSTILNETDNEQLGHFALASPANKDNASYENVAKKHKLYQDIIMVLGLFESDDRHAAKEAQKILYSKDGLAKVLKEVLMEKDKVNGLSEEEGKERGAMSWYGALMYIGTRHLGSALHFYKQVAEKYGEDILDKLDSKSSKVGYIESNLSGAKDEDKGKFYANAMYREYKEAA